MEKIALIYDFDYTLCTKDTPNFGLFELYNLNDEFFVNVNHKAREMNMEGNLAYLYFLNEHAKNCGKPLTKQILSKAGENIQFFPGVETWFERINKFGKENGVEVEHYLISSGILEIIEGSPIAKNFKKIFASSYHYNKDGVADWPLCCINYTNKTQFIYRINRGLLNNIDDDLLNGYFPKEKRAVKYENMIYIGDGFTDVPGMKTTIQKGGLSIAVYGETSKVANELLKYGRCNKIFKADYREGKDLEKYVQEKILQVKNA